MIVEVSGEELLAACVPVIREAFASVADELRLTEASAPTNPAFMTLGRLREAWRAGTRLFLLLDGAGAALGSVGLQQGRRPGLFYVERLAVLPAHRHHGHGRALMDHALEAARVQGGAVISIGIVDENVRLKRWYRAQGFVETGTRRFPHLPFTVCYLEKPIA